MNFKVALFNKETKEEESVIVDQVRYKDFYEGYWVRLTGTDPSCYPEMAKYTDKVGETRYWASNDLSLMLKPNDPIDVVSVSTTDEPKPEPDPHF